MIINGKCEDVLVSLPPVRAIFADPPDNIGLEYNTYQDKREDYYQWLTIVLRLMVMRGEIVWLSLNSIHFGFGDTVQRIARGCGYSARMLIWRYTFGQYRDSDCGYGFRLLFRLVAPGKEIYADRIRVPSKRMLIGDKRAAGMRVPDDVWEFPRVNKLVGWHPTQHPLELMRRIIRCSCVPGETFVDCFGGSGTSGVVCMEEKIDFKLIEMDADYCVRMMARLGPTVPSLRLL